MTDVRPPGTPPLGADFPLPWGIAAPPGRTGTALGFTGGDDGQ